MSAPNYERINRMNTLGLVLLVSLMVAGLGDFAYSLSVDHLRVPLMLEYFTFEDKAWCFKICGLLFIGFLLASYEDFVL